MEDIVFIPGYNLLGWDLKKYYRPFKDYFSKKYNVYIFEYDSKAKDINLILNEFEIFLNKNKLNKFHLVSTSFGSYISLSYILERYKKKKIIKSVVLISGLIHGSALFRRFIEQEMLSKKTLGEAFSKAVYTVDKSYHKIPSNLKFLVISGIKKHNIDLKKSLVSGRNKLEKLFNLMGFNLISLLTFFGKRADGTLSLGETTLEGYPQVLIKETHETIPISLETFAAIELFFKHLKLTKDL